MTKASDNAFPSLLITEGTEPSAPAAGKQRLYIDSTTHLLKVTNSSGTDTNVGFGTGTSMPGSPATGQRIWRTDLGIECYYDGTRWLTTQIFTTTGNTETVNSISTNLVAARHGLWSPTYSVYLLDMRGPTVVITTNDGSKYWTLALKKGSDNSTIGSFTTAADTAGTTTDHLVTIGAVSTEKNVYIDATKTSTPGILYQMLQVTYRLVVT